jgi:hypothetical protein
MATNNLQSSAYPALADFQRDLHIRANLQSLPSFTGNPLSRFDTWLESFESIISRSDLSEDDVILELQGKLTDKAHKVIKYIVANHPNDYDAIRERLLDHFHGDETVEKYLKKFKKAHRKHKTLFKKLPLQSRDTCSTLDFNLYDVHNKKLNTLEKVTLPIRYGKSTLLQEFIITDGISEDCILGWDAIRKHGFTIDGETSSIYLAKETLGQAKSRAPDISIILHKRRAICRRTAVVVEAKTTGSFPYVSPLATFIFTPSEKLPKGIHIQQFIGRMPGSQQAENMRSL